MKAITYAKTLYVVSVGAVVYAFVQTVLLARIEPLLLLTTPLAMVPLCVFGALCSIFNVNRYPVYSGLGALLAVLTAAMV